VTELLGYKWMLWKIDIFIKAHTGSPTAYSLLAPSSSNDWRYGQLLSESHYNAAGILQYNKKYDYLYLYRIGCGMGIFPVHYGVCVDGYMYRTDREECNDESGLVQLAQNDNNFDQNGQNPIAFTKQYFYEIRIIYRLQKLLRRTATANGV